MGALTATTRRVTRSSGQSLSSSLKWSLVIGAGFVGGALSVLVGELISSGAIHDMVTSWQVAGSEMGGAFNGVSHSEMELMKRGAAIALRGLA